MTHRPAVYIGSAFVAGIVCQNLMGVGLVCGLLILLPAFLLLARRWRRFWVPVLLGFVFLGGALAAWDAGVLPLNHIGRRVGDFKGRDCDVVCRMVSSPREVLKGLSPKTNFLCDIEQINGEAWQGRVLVNLYGAADAAFGDRMRMTGKIARPYLPSSGSRRVDPGYFQRQGIDAFLHVRRLAPREVVARAAGLSLDSVSLGCREYMENIFRKYLSPGEAGLMNAMLLGPRDGIPVEVYDIFRKTGTAHIIAISGMNMTLTAAGLMLILGMLNIPRCVRAWLAVFILGFYSLMAGNGAPVARSALMASVVILSFVLERETDALNNLALAGLILLAADPRQLQDVGFQLSFVCVASLILLAPLILRPFEDELWCRKKWVWFLVESAAVTLSAFIGSAGILMFVFGYVSPIGLLVNLPVIPLMGLVTSLGFLVLGFGVVLPWLAGPFAVCLKIVLNVSMAVLTAAGQAPVIRVENLPWPWLLLYYGALAGMVMIFNYSCRVHSRTFIDKPLPL